MIRHLIVNKLSGHFSAMPDAEEMASSNYITTPDRFVVYEVECDVITVGKIWSKRDNTVVIGPGLPLTHEDQITDPTFVYIKVVMPVAAGDLATVALVEASDAVKLSVAKELTRKRLGHDIEYSGFRFKSEALGKPMYYVFATFNFDIQSARSEFPNPLFGKGAMLVFDTEEAGKGSSSWIQHTTKQLNQVAKDYTACAALIRERLVKYNGRIEGAQSVEELAAMEVFKMTA